MAVYKRGRVWWYRFTWKAKSIRESTKQTNKRVAEQIEAAHKTSLAKGEVGIRDRLPVSTLRLFIEQDFQPFVASRFQNKPKTLEYYTMGIKNPQNHSPLADCPLDEITNQKITGFIETRQARGLQISSINRQLGVLRRMLKLAVEWGKLEKVPPKIEMLPGERHRDRVLSFEEETCYLNATTTVGECIQESYRRALEGIRATMRGEQPIEPEDPFLLRDVTTLLTDCGLRPEKCFRLQWEHVREGAVHVPFGKTANARRTIPLSERAAAIFGIRRFRALSCWVFPSRARSGQLEKSALKKQHPKACKIANVTPFPLYAFRHTCLTRWIHTPWRTWPVTAISQRLNATFTRRRKRCWRLSSAPAGRRVGTKLGTVAKLAIHPKLRNRLQVFENGRINGRGERIRTSGLLDPNQAL
jgi:integrase